MQQGEERFHRSVVTTRANPARGSDQTDFIQCRNECAGSKLTSITERNSFPVADVASLTTVAGPAYLGVDFGTSHTAAVIQSAGTVTPLLFDGSPLLPSALFAETDGTLSVGWDAVHSVRLDPARFEPNPKRRVDDGEVLLGDQEFGVIEMIAAVLTRVVEEYERVTGSQPERVTLTYPAAWGPTRRLVLIDAAEKAGITSPKLVPEPVAAATHFADSLHVRLGSAVVVADFGGGTFDCSMVRRTGSGFDVVTSDGHDQLGGIDIDEAIVMHLRSQINGDEDWARLSTPATPADRRHRRSFYDDVRSAKERLSRRQSVDLYLPVFDRDIHLTREELDSVARPLVERATTITKAVIRISAVANEDIAGLYLVGGGSRMPLVATMLHQSTGLTPTVLEQPELVVAQGALLTTARPQAPPPAPGGPTPVMTAAKPPTGGTPPAAATPTRTVPAEKPQGRAMPKRLWLVPLLLVFQLVLTMSRADIAWPLLMVVAVGLLASAGLLLVRHRIALWTILAIQIAITFLHWI